MKRSKGRKVLEAEFDTHSDSYRQQHQASVAFGGFELDYFANYKAEVARSLAEKAGLCIKSIMDFGAGIGNATNPLREAFPEAAIKCVDVSESSLLHCAALGVTNSTTHVYDGRTLPFENSSIDMAFTACVFHHIPAEDHVPLLAEIRRVLKPGAMIVMFEHNPLNPLTRLAVARCPFDENAVLIGSGEMKRRFRAAGFADVRVNFRIFFPGFLKSLRGLEPWLESLPVGGQYYVTAQS